MNRKHDKRKKYKKAFQELRQWCEKYEVLIKTTEYHEILFIFDKDSEFVAYGSFSETDKTIILFSEALSTDLEIDFMDQENENT